MPYLTTHKALRAWYRRYGRRDLPWRTTADPYAIYVSEIMLQQTQVRTVLERYYGPFLARFPTLSALASAPSEDVLKQWEGLGYYNRARYLHETAKRVAPTLPMDIAALTALPGIGRNTAHAIAAFAYHQPVAVMEANVKRVLHRVFALEQASEKTLWEKAGALLDAKHPFEYNQAMMDIGALVCTKTAPRCDSCPLATICKGKRRPLAYPAPKKKARTPVRRRNILVFTDAAGRCYLTARAGRFLHGVYGFPEYDGDIPSVAFEKHHYHLADMEYLGEVAQTYSHFRLEAGVYRMLLPGRRNAPEWKSLQEIESLPLSRADAKVLRLLLNA
ncbi:MAG: A/G-specific adenine glycosylase [Alphaproteobacteria bacterium]|nr:A/G-specific adenine glycosylase [Alphaproteobacteria bacterium]